MKVKRIIGSILFTIVLAAILFFITSYNKGNIIKPEKEYINSEVETVSICLDEYPGWNELLIANGGLVTTEDSINAKNGIKIHYVIENESSISSNKLISGEVQGCGYTINRTAHMQDSFEKEGVQIIIPFITNYSNGGDGIVTTPEIKTVEDLVGKKIAVPQFTEAHTLIEWLMEKSSLTDEQIQAIRKSMMFFKTTDEIETAFLAGDVDAAVTWEPSITNLTSTTESRILFDTSRAPSLIMTALVFERSFAESHEDFIVKLIDGALESKDQYLTDFRYLKEMDAFQFNTDEELYEMCTYASTVTYADNLAILNTTGKTVYEDMAKIWISIGQKANPEKAEEIFTDQYISKLAGKYDENDFTSFTFTADGRKAAETIPNKDALLKVTLTVQFDADDARIKSSSYEELKEFAKVANTLQGYYIQIEGNTAKVDGLDGEEMSLKRANSVARYLKSQGVDGDRLITKGNGDKNPIPGVSNDTEEGRAKNRRTEVFFKVTGY